MTAQQLSLLDPARQLELLPEPTPEPLPGECPWCGRVNICIGGPDCRYVSPFTQEEPQP